MGLKRWNELGFCFLCFLVLCVSCFCLNQEGLILIAFRVRINSDPFGALKNWNRTDASPCLWSGVGCVHAKVHMLNLSGFGLEGTLAPELGRLTHLTALLLSENEFSGEIPKEIGELEKLEVLDLRGNKFGGVIPNEIRTMQSLKYFPGFDTHAPVYISFGGNMPSSSEWKEAQFDNKLFSFSRRRSLLQASNLAAAPASTEVSRPSQKSVPPITRSSGSFQVVPRRKPLPPLPSPAASPTHHPTKHPYHTPAKLPVESTSEDDISSSFSNGNMWKFALICGGVAILLVAFAIVFCMCRTKAVATIGPWKTGLSGQLQKAFVTGVPNLNRSELDTACEDYSNIISTSEAFNAYKGTLSSGVEIAVASSNITSLKDWNKASEMAYRKKIDILSRVNHKNFINLIGYCEENEPFTRMIVFEYAPNGSLFEHLHVKDVEPLDWLARMRLVMGVAYCIQYMHHDLNPPVVHPHLSSTCIFLTDDYAAKVAIVCFSPNLDSKNLSPEEREYLISSPTADPLTNVYFFGVLLLEIISGKLPYSEEQGSLVNWAVEYLSDRRSISYLIDPTLTTYDNNELDVICEVIQECIQPDPRLRPTMKEITTKLRSVIAISPDQAVPRLSPLWWAELEILSVEAT